ncbi:hypothetical protein HY604_01960 [Candidatus Peregrinibacteria bacterium]|nr:hypothetical protein [Candidatus Peregrinibacteria bacterium]
MATEQANPREGMEERFPGRRQGLYTREQQLGFIVRDRLHEVRPADLCYPQNKFAEDGKDGKTVNTTGAALRADITRFFDRLEGKVDATKLELIRQSFETSVAIWEEAGLFSEARTKRGYRKPNFEEDYRALFGMEDTDMMAAGKGLDRGYGRAVWAPEDVPVASKDPKTLTYLKLAKGTLLEAYHGTAGGKAPNTLLVGPNKKVLTADQIDLSKILWQWERYKKSGIVYNPRELDPRTHGGQTEEEMLAALQGTEKTTGGVLRMERDQLIMPKDVGQTQMSDTDWHAAIKEGKLPKGVRAQDAKQALAYIIHCLKTEGWIPDYYDHETPANSRIALAPETYIPDESDVGAVPAFHWPTRYGRFYAGGYRADRRRSDYGVRGGVRKNNEAA